MNKEQMGERIRELRKSHNMSAEELSEKLDMSGSFIGLLERGARTASLSNVVKMSEIFNVSLDYLVLGNEGRKDGGNG